PGETLPGEARFGEARPGGARPGEAPGSGSRPAGQFRVHWISTVRSRERAARPQAAVIPNSVRSMRAVARAVKGPRDRSQPVTARVTGRGVPRTVRGPVRTWLSARIRSRR